MRINILLIINNVKRLIGLLLFLLLFNCNLISADNTQVSILFETRIAQSVGFILELSGVRTDQYLIMTEKIYENKHVSITDFQSFPQKGKILMTVIVPDNGSIKSVENFLLGNGWDFVFYKGLKIHVKELSERYIALPNNSEFKQISKP